MIRIECIDLVTKQNISGVSSFKTLSDVKDIQYYDYFIIASETSKHYEHLKYICSKVENKKILVEKPLYDKTYKLLESNNLIFTAYNLRFHPVLEKLKNDDSEYVRRSVANNLNDISKDNPHLVIELARTSLGYSLKTDWLIKHACRTLLKQGHPDVMVLFGFPKPKHIEIVEFKLQNIVEMGESLEFSFRLISRQQALGKLRLEYAIDFYKKNGSLSRKVFKISESDVKGNSKTVVKFHSFKAISTRKYYAGNHALSVIANGQELASLGFQVT